MGESMNPIIIQSLLQVVPTILQIVFAVVVLELLLYLVLKKWLNYKHSLAFMLVLPSTIGLFALVGYPLVYNLINSFSDINPLAGRWPTRPGSVSYSLENFIGHLRLLFTEPVLQQRHFFPVLFRTFTWTFLQVSVHVVMGMVIAILLNRPMKLRGLYRTIILLPWAIPQVIAVLAWRGEFNFEYGYFNIFLRNLGFDAIPWMSNPFWNFIAINMTNWWLGVPFMSVILLGGLQSIDASFYEAAEIDGAGKVFQFKEITMPLIKPVLTPAVILGVVWTFNNFNVAFFINQQNLESSDILVTALFRAAFQYNRYGFASVFSIVIFLILIIMTLLYMRLTNFRLNTGVEKRKLAQAKTVGE
jgi:arabinogalactan oligomer/maltooligosaccharide transport system permease protein